MIGLRIFNDHSRHLWVYEVEKVGLFISILGCLACQKSMIFFYSHAIKVRNILSEF